MPLPIRKNVLGMKPYSPGKPIGEVMRELGLTRVVKLASNENPWGPSPKAVAAMQIAAKEVHLYPDGASFELVQALSRKFGVTANQIVLGNGSDELLRMIGWILIGSPDDEVIMADPSFIVYDATAEIAPCKLIKVPLNADLAHDLPAMAKRVSAHTRIIFIANPNNPTATFVRKDELDRFLRDVPETAMVVLDEAYFEFAREHPDYPDGRAYVLEGRPNVAALRTFSKAYGLAGLRCGYGFVAPEVADAIERCRQPFHINRMAQEGCAAALDDFEHLEKTVHNTQAAIRRLTGILESVGAKVAPSAGNFVWADMGRPTKPLFQALLTKGAITRTGDVFGTPTCLRVSVGTEEELDLFEDALKSAMREPVTT